MGEIKCYQCAYSVSDAEHMQHLCDYCGITNHCKIVEKNGVRTVQKPEDCTFFEPSKRSFIKRPPKSLKSVDRDILLNLWRAGKTDTEIAEETGMSRNAVTQWRRKSRLEKNIPPTCRRYNFEGARALYESGANARQMADAVGCSLTTLYAWLQEEGLTPPGRESRAAHCD